MIKQFILILNVLGIKNRAKALKLLLILTFIIILELLNLSLIIPILTLVFTEGGSQNIPIISNLSEYINIDLNNVLSIGLIFLTIVIIKILFLLFFEYKTQKYIREILIDVYFEAYSYFLYSPWQETSKYDHAYIMRNILSDTGTFVMEGVLKFISLIKNTLILIFILIYLFLINFQVSFYLLSFLILFTTFFIIFFKKHLLELSLKTATFDRLRLKYVSESVLNLRDIKLNRNFNYFLDLFKRNEEKVTSVVILSEILKIIPRYLLEIIIVVTLVILITLLQVQNYNMINLIPILGLYSFALLRMIPIFIVYNRDVQAVRTAKFQIDEVIKNSSRYKKIYNENFILNNTNDDQKSILKDITKLKISNLSFSYSTNKKLFNNVNLELDINKTIYLEGPNGSGKSTFVDLISGLLKPSKGKIEINNYNLNLVIDDWLQNLGYVSQSNFLTNDSIKDNIIFGRKNISENEIFKTLEIVELDQLIKSLENGIDTNIGSLGNFFSGGQKQRISIARALVKNPKVIILDEATNALDQETERNFLNIIDKIKKDKLIIFIAHSEVIKNFCDVKLKIKDYKIERSDEKK